VICHDLFNHFVLLINGHVLDIIAKWAISADVSGLATPVAQLRGHIWCLSPIDGCGDAGWGVCMKGQALLLGSRVSGH
jgi:hypothetical protein